MAAYDSYIDLKKRRISSCQLIQYHIGAVLSAAHRRLTEKESYTHPWCIKVERNIHFSLFSAIHQTIRDYKTSFGREIKLSRDKKKELKEITITFHHMGTFIFHLSKLLEKNRPEIKAQLKRVWKSGNRTEVVVSEEKPVILTYKVKKHQLKLEMSYSLINKYGTVCSY